VKPLYLHIIFFIDFESRSKAVMAVTCYLFMMSFSLLFDLDALSKLIWMIWALG